MYIDGPQYKYRIIHVIRTDERLDVYQCVREHENRREHYAVCKIKDFKQGLLKVFSELKNAYFTDLVECFTLMNEAYFVFYYAEGESLMQKLLNESLTLNDRMQIGAAILGRLIIKDVPYYLACSGLLDENVRITEHLDVNFAYSLEDIENSGRYGIKDVNAGVLKWIRLLFKIEIKDKVSEELLMFCKELSKGRFDNYNDIYHAYAKACTQIHILSETEGGLVKKRGLVKLLEKAGGFCSRWKNIIAVLVFAGIIILSILFFRFNEQKNMRAEKAFDYIGVRELY